MRATITAEQKQRLSTLWKGGVKAEAICAELGISWETLKKVRRRLGLMPRVPASVFTTKPILLLSEHNTVRAYELWLLGHNTNKIASLLNLPEPAIYNSVSNYRERLRKGET